MMFTEKLVLNLSSLVFFRKFVSLVPCCIVVSYIGHCAMNELSLDDRTACLIPGPFKNVLEKHCASMLLCLIDVIHLL